MRKLCRVQMSFRASQIGLASERARLEQVFWRGPGPLSVIPAAGSVDFGVLNLSLLFIFVGFLPCDLAVVGVVELTYGRYLAMFFKIID